MAECSGTGLEVMPTEMALDSFWDLIQRSGVISEEDSQTLRREYEQDFPNLDTASKIADDLVAREHLTRWQADMLLQGRHKGFFLGPYRLLDLLGKGGMGSVYLAEHQMIGRRAAVKVLPSKQISRRPSMVERFRREAQAVASLDHPNIVRAYEFNKELLDKTEVHYLAMQFVEGQDLQVLVEKEGVLDYVRAADYIRQAALGLAHAHEAGLVHRDIKPANLLINNKGVVKLLDLGLVKSFEDPDEAALTGEHENTVLGTADYLAPEQAVSSRDVDARADVYSLGYTLYYALTGHPPFPEGSINQRMLAHQQRHAEPVTKDRPDTPKELAAIMEKMIQKQPVDRFQSAADVANELANWLFEHADDEWILGNPGLLDDRSDSGISSPREPTHPASDGRDETELDLMPLDDEASKSASRTQERSGNKKASEQKEPVASNPTRNRKDKERQVQAESAGTPSFPPLERDPIGSLFETELQSPEGRALPPLERVKSFWTIAGIAQRLNLPPALVLFFLVMILALIVAVLFLIVSSL